MPYWIVLFNLTKATITLYTMHVDGKLFFLTSTNLDLALVLLVL